MEKCQRCSKKPITLQCFNCPIINRICSLCDKIIHNTKLKIDHVRVPIENVTLNLKENQSFENKEEPNNKMILIEQNFQEESKEQENINNCSEIKNNDNSIEIMNNLNMNINNNINTNDLSTLNQSKNNEDKTIEDNSQKYSHTKFYLLRNKNKPNKDYQQFTEPKNNLNNINENKTIEESK